MGTQGPSSNSKGYAELLGELKRRIREARVRASLAVNRELVVLYWAIGRDILARQQAEGWGTKVVKRLANDLQRAFPDMQGLSARNLRYMRAFAEAWPDEGIVQQLVAQLPWGHNVRLLDKVKDPDQRPWYARATIEHGWSRSALVLQIDSGLHERGGAAVTNFRCTLPQPDSDLAQQVVKDPYNFEFLAVSDDLQERVLERALVDHIRDFLLELGRGFSFVGSQVPLLVGGDAFRVDLLFYHLHLRCYVVIELKAGEFRPEHAGKLNFYLSAVDDQLRHESDKPTIGLILCRGRNRVVAEYALRGSTQPLGVSEYELTQALPKQLAGELPTVAQIEAEFEPEPRPE